MRFNKNILQKSYLIFVLILFNFLIFPIGLNLTQGDSVSHIDFEYESKGVFVSGDYAYIVSSMTDEGKGYLHIVNITDPTNPSVFNKYNFQDSEFLDVEVIGDYAYVAKGNWDVGSYIGGLVIFDISNASNIELKSSVNFGRCVLELDVQGDFAYCIDKGALNIVNISNPISPALIPTSYSTSHGVGICVEGNYAYIVEYYYGLRIVDITDPYSPLEVGSYETPGRSRGICIEGDLAFIADAGTGIVILDISNKANPSKVSICDTPGAAKEVIVNENYVYVADWEAGLQIIDLEVLRRPKIIYSLETEDLVFDLDVSGEYIYLAENEINLRIVNASLVPTSTNFEILTIALTFLLIPVLTVITRKRKIENKI
ncbi:MAG: hypothetical protein H7644_02050 [Candidatus Heimdallarchaeota archaeon]|nr:hypothetical protein [Candidatus Heimdallarchaeota archaeon]MCK5142527.1 hypothetical protein [Candidatus Heimdallarchaeota archaeon]